MNFGGRIFFKQSIEAIGTSSFKHLSVRLASWCVQTRNEFASVAGWIKAELSSVHRYRVEFAREPSNLTLFFGDRRMPNILCNTVALNWIVTRFWAFAPFRFLVLRTFLKVFFRWTNLLPSIPTWLCTRTSKLSLLLLLSCFFLATEDCQVYSVIRIMKQRREDRKQVGFLTTGYSGLNVRESLPRTRPVTRILCGGGGGGC